MVFSKLLGRDVSNYSEEWRHECECRWLLANKPTRVDKHFFLYGVYDRAMLFEFNSKTGQTDLKEGYTKLWPKWPKPLMHHRGLERTDKILADAKTLYDQQSKP